MNANGHRGEVLLPNGDGELLHPWHRWSGESTRAYEALETYLYLGSGRSIEKVGQKCAKSPTLLKRWSARWNWVERARAYDQHQSRTIYEKLLLSSAAAREREMSTAQIMQARAAARFLRMSDAEVAQLSPLEAVAMARCASEIQNRAIDIDPTQSGFFAPDLKPPTFIIQIIQPAAGMVGVQLGDGQYGYIPQDQVERFRLENPDAVVII